MFNENEHPRDSDGKFTDKNGTPAEHKRLIKMGVEEDFVRLTPKEYAEKRNNHRR